MSAKVIRFRARPDAAPVSRGSAQWVDHSDDVLARAHERLGAALEAEAYHRGELRAAQANAATQRQYIALLESKISPRPEPRANETPGSPSVPEGDPTSA